MNKIKIIKDVPYAGVVTVDFILYKWEDDFPSIYDDFRNGWT